MIDATTFFREESDILLSFLVRLSKPEYLTEEGQEIVDDFIKKVPLVRNKYLSFIKKELRERKGE